MDRVCCFTGHRNIDKELLPKISTLLDEAMDSLIDSGVSVFRAGGAVGFDMLAALKVLDRKAAGANLTLELYLPCKEQSELWSDRNKEYYGYILENADSVVYVRDEYTKWCMHERNRALVDGADFCIAYCGNEKGGSAYTLSYAKKRGLRVLNLYGLL